MTPVLKTFAYALVPTGIGVFVSYAIAWWGYGNLYYMGQLLPAFMVLYVLLAWFAYLRRSTSFLARSTSTRKPASEVLGHHESELARDLPEDKVSGRELKELIYSRDQNGLIIPKAHAGTGDREPDPPESPVSNPSGKLIAVLLWSAFQLAILSTALYHLLGIGAKFF
ncbi:MAG TPA: hypothetical protein GX510_01265 [Firmicutes bacterium]|nr:hypothetical protein [Candidatus Fermentithermobacillaceae bacterium]